MKANRMWLFSDVLEKNKRVFKVPVYQRNYDWTNIQCEKLFQDIMKKPKLNLKNIVLFRIGYLCLTLISTCWNWKRMRRSSSLAIEIFSLPRSSAWELGH